MCRLKWRRHLDHSSPTLQKCVPYIMKFLLLFCFVFVLFFLMLLLLLFFPKEYSVILTTCFHDTNYAFPRFHRALCWLNSKKIKAKQNKTTTKSKHLFKKFKARHNWHIIELHWVIIWLKCRVIISLFTPKSLTKGPKTNKRNEVSLVISVKRLFINLFSC